MKYEHLIHFMITLILALCSSSKNLNIDSECYAVGNESNILTINGGSIIFMQDQCRDDVAF